MRTELEPASLQRLFLFESLDEEQVAWIAEHADVVDAAAGEDVCREGDPARCFWVLCDGEIAVIRHVRGDEVEVSRSSRPGSYGGATEAYVEGEHLAYKHTLRACTDSRFLALPAKEFGARLRAWFPLAMHLVEGLAVGMQRSNTAVGERERLLALGSLSAGLTHELNNPAAAAIRATESLRDRVAGMRHKLAMLASGKLDGRQNGGNDEDSASVDGCVIARGYVSQHNMGPDRYPNLPRVPQRRERYEYEYLVRWIAAVIDEYGGWGWVFWHWIATTRMRQYA